MPNWHASRRGLAAAANYPAQSDCWSPPLGQRSAVPTPMPTYARLARHGGHKALARKAVLAAPGAPPKHRSRSRARFGPQANFARADPSAAGCFHPPILRWREVGVRDSARGWLMYLPKDAAPHRLREAGKARENRGEIVRALASGQVTRRQLFNWGLFTASGLLAWKHGLNATVKKASGPDGNGKLVKVAGDYRELQGSMWAHDHRFFFTAENVYKGNFMAVNFYSGPDRGNEALSDGVNLKLPSGSLLAWGNVDFDVNLVIHDLATDADGQLFFDIFTTEGFLGDLLCFNMQFAPFLEVLPRKYRFRLLNACMSRFIKLALSWNWTPVPLQFIANDGNLVVAPIDLLELDEQGSAERYDIIVDFSKFRIGDRVYLVNVLQQRDGRKPDKALSLREAMAGVPDKDPAVGPLLEFRVVGAVNSVDVPGHVHKASKVEQGPVPATLTQQIAIVDPVRTRVVEFGRSGAGDSRDPSSGQCTPDCPEVATSFPWTIKINGEAAHSFNANRISLLIPKPGEIEHWTYINGGGGWDHPIHL